MATSTYPPKRNEGVLQFSVFLSFFVLFISVWHFTCRITIVHSEEQKENALIFYVYQQEH